jgi:hypothetical protein
MIVTRCLRMEITPFARYTLAIDADSLRALSTRENGLSPGPVKVVLTAMEQ